ncbi:CGNR zinc finger domain-containing protein [Streptosporangium sp. NPDC020145]|uniref:CGNR zinc finger domain-containing protein n=1 Tax=Streptosporangium sp. NPDC020145 TaxID=3154694 RepID=UPI0034413C60
MTPAPSFRSGSGRLCLDFIRTLRHRGTARPEEELPDPAALAAWVGRFGPWESVPEAAAVGHDAQARQLREAIHTLVAAAREPVEGGTALTAALSAALSTALSTAGDTVNRIAALPVPAPQLDGSGRLRWLAAAPVPAVLALIARDAVDLVTGPSIDRVHECADPDCHALFLDSSRPGTRRWCSMNTCGNKAKKQTLRGRSVSRPEG